MDKQLFHYKGIKTHMFIVGILTVCQAISIIFQALFLATAITNMFKGTASYCCPSLFFLALLVYLLLRHFIQWLKERLSFHFAEKTSFDLQNLLFVNYLN